MSAEVMYFALRLRQWMTQGTRRVCVHVHYDRGASSNQFRVSHWPDFPFHNWCPTHLEQPQVAVCRIGERRVQELSNTLRSRVLLVPPPHAFQFSSTLQSCPPARTSWSTGAGRRNRKGWKIEPMRLRNQKYPTAIAAQKQHQQ